MAARVSPARVSPARVSTAGAEVMRLSITPLASGWQEHQDRATGRPY